MIAHTRGSYRYWYDRVFEGKAFANAVRALDKLTPAERSKLLAKLKEPPSAQLQAKFDADWAVFRAVCVQRHLDREQEEQGEQMVQREQVGHFRHDCNNESH